MYEIPVNPDNKFAAALKNANTGKLYGDKANSKTSFLILKDDAGYHAYVMTIIADSAYLKGDPTKLARNSYAKRDTDFSGLVLYFTPKGVYLNGYAYKNGQQLVSTTSGSSSTKQVQSTGSAKSVTTVAQQDCIDWYYDEYIGGYYITSFYAYTTCSDNGSFGSSGGGGSGSGSGATPPLCPPAAPDNSSINTGHPTVSQAAPIDNPIGDDGGFPPPAPKPLPCVVVATITNNVKDPCLKKMVEAAISRNIQYNLTQSMNGIFSNNTNFNLDFVDAVLYDKNGNIDTNTDGATIPIGNPDFTVVQGTTRAQLNGISIKITLNNAALVNASQEFVTETIIHEALHAYFRTINIAFDHTVMIDQYIPWF